MSFREPPPARSADLKTMGVFAVASLAAIALGSAGLALAGVPPGTWLRNPAAWLVGLAAAGLILAAGRSPGLSKAVLLLTLAALAATFLAPAQSGVHRWIDAGPLHINIAALLLPMAIVALATLGLAAPLSLAASATIGLLLVAQPDASQTTAFLLAAGFLLHRSSLSTAAKVIAALAMAALVIGVWLTPDPLEPVPEVEGIFSLLSSVSLVLAALAALALAIASLSPLRQASATSNGRADAAIALSLYFALVALMPLAGAFPVPLVGLGMSFPVGYWLGMALLCARPARPGRF